MIIQSFQKLNFTIKLTEHKTKYIRPIYTWKTASATNCSSLRVSWCHSFLWYKSASVLYQSESSGWVVRRESRYWSAAISYWISTVCCQKKLGFVWGFLYIKPWDLISPELTFPRRNEWSIWGGCYMNCCLNPTRLVCN